MFDPTYQLGLDVSLLTSRDTVRFFDIDGVLSIYGYGTDGINVCSDDKFDTFIETFDLYKYAVAPEFMREYILHYTTPENNYIVSQSGSPAQDKQKIAFVNRCYPGAFPESHILFPRTSDKTEAVRKVLDEMTDGLSTPHIVIDDSVGVLSRLQDTGISAVHVSSLLLLAGLKKDTEKADETVREISSGKTTPGNHTGERIKEIRLARGLSRSDLGGLLGLDQNRVQQYENGSRTPKMELLKKFALALNVSPAALTDPDTMSTIGAVRALFDIENYHGTSLHLSEGKYGREISVVIDPTSKLYREAIAWHEKQEKKKEKMKNAKTEAEREKIEKEYKDWEWRYNR